MSVCNNHASVKRKRVRARSAPWLTPELKKQMFERDRSKKTASILNTPESWNRYKQLKNRVNHTLKAVKVEYYNTYFKDNFKNIKQTWRGINTLMENGKWTKHSTN